MNKTNTERNNPLLKTMDKLIGCPVVFILGMFHRNHAKPKSYRNIAVIKTAAVGDTIILSAMLKEIKVSYPEANITFICSNNNVAMVKTLDNVDHIEKFDMKRPLSSLKRVKDLGRFDLVLDFGPWPRINAIITWMICGAYKVGFKRNDTYRHYIYDNKVEHSDELHEIENYRNILRGAGIEPVGLLPDFRTKQHIRNDKYVVFHLFPGGAMDMQRRWQNERWLELAGKFQKKYGSTILLSGGPADSEEAVQFCTKLTKQGILAENIAGKYSLAEMASVLQYAQLVVSVNTGIMHYAAAVGVPLVAIHGATSEVRWGPLSNNSIVVKSNPDCQPCISLGFESNCTKPICMEKVTVNMVMTAVENVLEA